MRKFIGAVALALGLTVAAGTVEAVAPAPASADSICRIGSPQINNSLACAKATLFYDIGGYPYYVSSQYQVKATSNVVKLQVRNGSNGAWYDCGPQASYQPFAQGVMNAWCAPPWRPARARLVVTNTITGAVTTYGWNPFPLV